jgi:hypothetical protein
VAPRSAQELENKRDDGSMTESLERRRVGREVDSAQLTADRTERNPRTGLRPMRGTKVDDRSSGLARLKVLLEVVGSEPSRIPRYCWMFIKTNGLQIGQFVIG